MNTLRDRSGKSGIGCLGSIVILITVAIFGGRFIPPWLHYVQFRDEMKTEARYGASLPDSSIKMYLLAQIDTLGLPPEARKISIRHRQGRPPTITIMSEYTEKVHVPIFGLKLLHFKPTIEEPL